MWIKCRLKLLSILYEPIISFLSSSSLSNYFVIILLLSTLIFNEMAANLTTTTTITAKSLERKIVRIDEKNITAYNNRNLTIFCSANIENFYSNDNDNESLLNFTTDARMVLTFMNKPRDKKPLHQMQSFLHCHDPYRKQCYSVFNLDLSCLEDQMDKQLIQQRRQQQHYEVEAACQVDDVKICSARWMRSRPFDCFDLANVFVINAPKLGEKCLYISENRTVECGVNQDCNTDFGICLCRKSYIASNKQCVRLEQGDELLTLLVNDANITSTFVNDLALSPEDFDDDNDNDGRLKLSKSTLRAMVIFLLIIAIILCIALAIVIIWRYGLFFH
ncbi:hypothetical protein BLA29_007147 [Euroglyphus maynei]|uniref:Uncharacterized protein n=1 Tax=Euroglyphus maynei TaxID=6958 RepID=A0A1Y3BE29_EURMA|nr:hypothetical protein BLA29_007147 [Euroglyphus maynei]